MHSFIHALSDSIKLLPFLFLTYLAMEFMQHKLAHKTETVVAKAGKWGPLFGGLLGVVPQCGFSASGASLYAGKLISMGTLIAIFLSTSDEMLPILLSNKIPLPQILSILGIKLVMAIVVGFAVDGMIHPKENAHTGEIVGFGIKCDCNHHNVWLSALRHTLEIFLFIFLINIVLEVGLSLSEGDWIQSLFMDRELMSVFLAGLVGLIPNCAASVALTTLYVEQVISFGAMMAGLLAGSGVGILVLFRLNRSWKYNMTIVGILYGVGVGFGLLLHILTGLQ